MKITIPQNKWALRGLIALILILFVVAILYIFQSRKMSEIVENLNIEKTILTEEYQDLVQNYDSLHSNNDTLNLMLEFERERISHLVEEIKTIKATNMSKIREFQKELTTLRSVLRTYIVQIDSLNTINKELTRENIEQKRQYTQIKSSYQKLEATKDELEKRVTIASQLETANLSAEALTPSERSTNRSSRAGKLKVCFTLLKNLTAPVGMKEVFIRIERPDGQLLMHARSDLFTLDGTEINYSAKRTVEYGGDNTDVCIFYNVDTGELTEGEYTVDVFSDGFHIGKLNFNLR